MQLEKMIKLADALVEQGVLNKSRTSITVNMSVLGYSTEEALKRNSSIPSVDVFAPTSENDALSEFCNDLNRLNAQRVAACELLISTPYHLMQGSDVKAKLAISKNFEYVRDKLSFFTRKDVYSTLGTKDTNQIRAVSRLVKLNKIIELRIGAVAEPLYPTFQFDENLIPFSGIETLCELLSQHNKTVLDFCMFVADEEQFYKAVYFVSRKYKKNTFAIFADIEHLTALINEWVNDDIF
jgi:hypothetical protein